MVGADMSLMTPDEFAAMANRVSENVKDYLQNSGDNQFENLEYGNDGKDELALPSYFRYGSYP
jgi:hypothetical protein